MIIQKSVLPQNKPNILKPKPNNTSNNLATFDQVTFSGRNAKKSGNDLPLLMTLAGLSVFSSILLKFAAPLVQASQDSPPFIPYTELVTNVSTSTKLYPESQAGDVPTMQTTETIPLFNASPLPAAPPPIQPRNLFMVDIFDNSCHTPTNEMEGSQRPHGSVMASGSLLQYGFINENCEPISNPAQINVHLLNEMDPSSRQYTRYEKLLEASQNAQPGDIVTLSIGQDVSFRDLDRAARESGQVNEEISYETYLDYIDILHDLIKEGKVNIGHGPDDPMKEFELIEQMANRGVIIVAAMPNEPSAANLYNFASKDVICVPPGFFYPNEWERSASARTPKVASFIAQKLQEGALRMDNNRLVIPNGRIALPEDLSFVDKQSNQTLPLELVQLESGKIIFTYANQ